MCRLCGCGDEWCVGYGCVDWDVCVFVVCEFYFWCVGWVG